LETLNRVIARSSDRAMAIDSSLIARSSDRAMAQSIHLRLRDRAMDRSPITRSFDHVMEGVYRRMTELRR